MKWSRAFVLVALVVSFLSIQPVAAQSSGGCAGPFTGATSLDSDGDGVNDADEVIAGTDECDPADAPTSVCSEFVVDYDASTADSDGDGVTDAAETAAGTDACVAGETPTLVCGAYVADYDASTADTDGDGHTDAAETAGGTDPCDSSSVLSAAVTTTVAPTTTVADATTDAANEIPELALTGPSNAALGLTVAFVMLVLGAASLAIGRRVEA